MNKKRFLPYMIGITTFAVAFSSGAFAEDLPAQAGSWTVKTSASTTIGVHASTTGAGVRGIMPEIRNNIKIGKDGSNASTTLSRDAMKINIQTRQDQMRIIQMARVVWVRINATIIRLGKIVDKLDSRIAKIKAAGENTSVAESNSVNAKTSLGKARVDMDAVKTIILSISSTSPVTATATTTIKTDVSDAETQIKTAQSDIEKALDSLRGLQINAHASATSTGATQ